MIGKGDTLTGENMKVKIPGIIARLLFLVAFNAVFFIVAGFEHITSVWIAYSMIHVTYLVFAFTPLFTKRGKTAYETAAPLVMLSGINFALHFVIGLIFMLVAPEKYTFEIVLYIILLTVYLVLFFTLMHANAHTEASSARQEKEAFFIRNQSSKLKLLATRASDPELVKLLETLADNMHASPSRSSQNAAMIEASISMKVCELDMAVNEGRTDDAKRTCRELSYMIDERTRILKISY